MKIAVSLHFQKGYIANPYWPAREKLINIQKESGINRVRSQEKRPKVLDAYLKSKGLTLADYQALEVTASRPFYTAGDVGLATGNKDEIVVPAHHLHGMMAQGADLCPSAIRLARSEQIRTIAQFNDFRTGKTKADGVWDRFVTVKSGTGNKLSNQRSLRSDPYLSDLTAEGELTLVDDGQEERARNFLAWAGREIGVGAGRKLGWGRFTITKWAKI